MEQVWVWEYETDEGAHDLYMDIGEDIRFRVVDETFIDTSPTGPSSADASSSTDTVEPQRKEAPYTLVVRTSFVKVLWIVFLIICRMVRTLACADTLLYDEPKNFLIQLCP